MRVAAIIVTWNQTELTLACLATLLIDLPQEQIWVVDNGSDVPALPRIRQLFPRIQGLRLGANCGFAGGCNAGIAAALQHETEALLLLNNDALITPGTLAALVTELERDPQIAAVSPKVYYARSQQVLQSVGMRMDRSSGTTRMLGSGETDHGQYATAVDREALFGCVMLIRRAAWKQVGPFWEPFFSYAEESDWCLRARAAGWRLRYIPEGAVWHDTSRTLGADSPLKVYYISRNQYWLRQRNAGHGLAAWRGLLIALYRSGRTWGHYLRRRQYSQAAALVRGIWDYWRGRSGKFGERHASVTRATHREISR